MKKDITKEILKTKENLETMIASIKGLSGYTKQNQDILLNTFDKKNIEKYISIEKGLKKKVYTASLNGAPVYLKHTGLGLGVSRESNKFQVTNHTLFTFLKEYNLNPTDFTIHS